MPLVNIGQTYKRRKRTDLVRPVAGDMEMVGYPMPWVREPRDASRVEQRPGWMDGSERRLTELTGTPLPHDWADWRDASMARLLRRAEWVNNWGTLGIAWVLRRRRAGR